MDNGWEIDPDEKTKQKEETVINGSLIAWVVGAGIMLVIAFAKLMRWL